eukprot:5463418-Pleurochrysis_carterae.AAC.1
MAPKALLRRLATAMQPGVCRAQSSALRCHCQPEESTVQGVAVAAIGHDAHVDVEHVARDQVRCSQFEVVRLAGDEVVCESGVGTAAPRVVVSGCALRPLRAGLAAQQRRPFEGLLRARIRRLERCCRRRAHRLRVSRARRLRLDRDEPTRRQVAVGKGPLEGSVRRGRQPVVKVALRGARVTPPEQVAFRPVVQLRSKEQHALRQAEVVGVDVGERGGGGGGVALNGAVDGAEHRLAREEVGHLLVPPSDAEWHRRHVAAAERIDGDDEAIVQLPAAAVARQAVREPQEPGNARARLRAVEGSGGFAEALRRARVECARSRRRRTAGESR